MCGGERVTPELDPVARAGDVEVDSLRSWKGSRQTARELRTRERGGGKTSKGLPAAPPGGCASGSVSRQAGTGAGAGQQRPYSSISAQVTPASDGMSREISSSHTAFG